MPDNQTTDEKHFSLIYRYIFVISVFVLAYVLLITFLPIPEKNQRFVDIALAFLLGFISSNSQYLTGGNPMSKKGDQPTILQTGDNPVAAPVNNGYQPLNDVTTTPPDGGSGVPDAKV